MNEIRNPFVLLGITESATDAEIRKAYRRLARELHPDRNPDPEAAARFRDVAWAFEQIGREERRVAYLAAHAPQRKAPHGLGEEFASLFIREEEPEPPPARGDDIEYELEISLHEAYSGLQTAIATTLEQACAVCGGSGAAPGSDILQCRVCRGRGEHRAGRVRQPCASCEGRGVIISEPCTHCEEGRTSFERTVSISVPAGVGNGQRLRLPGWGGEGAREAGDLLVQLVVLPHPVFERLDEGEDILVRLPVSYAEAALGLRVQVPLLDGSVRILHLEPGSQHEDIIAIEGAGMPRLDGEREGEYGDLLVQLQIHVPEQLTRQQKRLLQQLSVLDETPTRKELLQKAAPLEMEREGEGDGKAVGEEVAVEGDGEADDIDQTEMVAPD